MFVHQWLDTIHQANRDFETRDLASAEYYLTQAINISFSLLNSWFDSEKAISAYLCSHHNLVHLLLIQQRDAEAKCYLLDLQKTLDTKLKNCRNYSLRYQALLKAAECNRSALQNNFLTDTNKTHDKDK